MGLPHPEPDLGAAEPAAQGAVRCGGTLSPHRASHPGGGQSHHAGSVRALSSLRLHQPGAGVQHR